MMPVSLRIPQKKGEMITRGSTSINKDCVISFHFFHFGHNIVTDE